MTRTFETSVVRYPGNALHASRPFVASIGNFDGIHVGHQVVLNRVVASANDMRQGAALGTALVSFYPHPLSVVAGISDPPRLMSLRQQLEVMSSIGIELLALVHFTHRLSELSARDFISTILVSRLDIRHLVIGEDARVGKNREGTPEVIRREMAAHGRTTEVVSLLSDSSLKIGSRTIRDLIAGGDFLRAKQHLGRPYFLDGKVVAGAGRGRTVGFPTANLVTRDQILPPRGVYAVRAKLDSGVVEGVANLGSRPTFERNGNVKVEVHLFDYSGDSLYGKRLEVEFVVKLRDEQKFESVEQLVAQIKLDCERAREQLAHVR